MKSKKANRFTTIVDFQSTIHEATGLQPVAVHSEHGNSSNDDFQMSRKQCLCAQPPLVSIGIPTYHRAESLRRTLACVTTQTYTNIEIIVSDNCSPGEETERVVRDFVDNGFPIRYVRQLRNRGATYNFQLVLSEAAGEYFMWAADDDLLSQNFVESMVTALATQPDAVGAFCSYQFQDVLSGRSSRVISVPAAYASGSRIRRIWHLVSRRDDRCIYGLFRRDVIVRLPLRKWAIGKGLPNDGAFQLLVPLLAAGKLAVSGDALYTKMESPNQLGRTPVPAWLMPLLSLQLIVYACQNMRKLQLPLHSVVLTGLMLAVCQARKLAGDIAVRLGVIRYKGVFE